MNDSHDFQIWTPHDEIPVKIRADDYGHFVDLTKMPYENRCHSLLCEGLLVGGGQLDSGFGADFGPNASCQCGSHDVEIRASVRIGIAVEEGGRITEIDSPKNLR